MAEQLNLINGTARTVQQLFSGQKYALDYYQREYTWTKANITELIEDLTNSFLKDYNAQDERKQVASYRPYFLGPIVTSSVEGTQYLVDGQQRMTSLTLLLIYLNHLSKSVEDREDLIPLVVSQKFGLRTYNINVDERKDVMEAIVKNRSYSPIDESVSVRNIWNRYHEIDTIFPNEIEDKSLVYFCDWLLERVVLVEINTTDQNMAIEIFETMNDRGLSLSNTDMLKGFLFTKIESELIPSTNILWRKRITELIDHGKNTDSEFIKHWLRGKYAETIRLGKKNATPKDFDLIGTAFHKWVRDKHKLIKLNCAQDYKNFVNSDFKKMSQRYIELLNASDKLTEGFEYVYYNSVTGLTLQYLPIMAAITPDDDDETFRCKVELVAKYLNIFVARRMVNYRNFGYSTIVYSIFNLAKDVRNKDCNILRNILSEQIKKIEESFDGIQWFGLNQRNGIHIRYLLARMTDWIENSKGKNSVNI